MYNEDYEKTPLCCCEYYNRQQERSHILLCCCNCEDLDTSVDRLIKGQFVPQETTHSLMSTLQDRLRIPWRGGAKQISLDAILPVVLNPIILYLSAQNVWCTVISFTLTVLLLLYAHKTCLQFVPRTKFFIVWLLTSIVILIIVFEANVVPLLEILPEENFILFALGGISVFLAYKVNSRASLGHAIHGDSAEDGVHCNGKASEVVCNVCRRKVPPRTFHCRLCQACVIKRDRHCAWLDCCIGEKNRVQFVMCLFFSAFTLIYSAILTLTTVCHPFFFMELILLPDDCSDVYHDLQIALCFVTAVGSLIYATFLLALLLQEFILISLGLTRQEWKQTTHGNCFGFPPRSDRPYDKGVLRNWSVFLFNR